MRKSKKHSQKPTKLKVVDQREGLLLKEEEISWEGPQWEPTQTKPLDLWSGLPEAEWRYEVMKERLSTYLPVDEEGVVRSVIETLAGYLGHAGPRTRQFWNELARLHSGEISDRARALMTRINVDRALLPLLPWPEAEVVELLLEELSLNKASCRHVRELAQQAREEFAASIVHDVREGAGAPFYGVEFRDYDPGNCRSENLRGLYLAPLKKANPSGR